MNKQVLSATPKRLVTTVLTFTVILLLLSPAVMYADTTPAQTQAQLEQQLKEVEAQIAEYQKQLNVTTSKKNTLATAIKKLQVKQQQLVALIKQTSLRVEALSKNIVAAKRDLDAAITKEAMLKKQIAASLVEVHQQEVRPLFLLASSDGLSNAFTQIQHYSNIADTVATLVAQVREVKQQVATKKAVFEDQKDDAQKLLQIKSIQNQELAGTLKEQTNLLVVTKGQEATYQATIADKKKEAAQIRSRIYELFNTGKQINFGQAVEIAKLASKLTGVRPAFLLAILTQESNLGKNVGTCNRANDPPEKSWKVVMKPERDQEPFKQITKELGLNIDATPVSCPMKNKDGSQLGWGGAMGPAQFIPSTWMGYKDKVAALTGKSPANPWDIRDAFVAAGIKLGSQGAKTEAGEWKAAMLYFSGSTNVKYRFYGDNVMATAKKYQADIDALN